MPTMSLMFTLLCLVPPVPPAPEPIKEPPVEVVQVQAVGVLEVVAAGRRLNEWVHAAPGRTVTLTYTPGLCTVEINDAVGGQRVGRGPHLPAAVADAFKGR